MDCLTFKSPIDSFEFETYDCTYDELAQAVGNNCLTCSFVFECIRTGAAGIHFSDIVKIDVLSDYYCELHLQTGFISLDMFTDGKLFRSLCSVCVLLRTCCREMLKLFWMPYTH